MSHLTLQSVVVAGNLALGGPSPIGARKANLSPEVTPYMQEIALSEQVSEASWRCTSCMHADTYTKTGNALGCSV